VENPKMNIGSGGIEQDRSIENMGFQTGFNVPSTTKPMTPYDQPAPLSNAVMQSNDSDHIPVGPSAHDKGGV
jgi:hypothetical protein